MRAGAAAAEPAVAAPQEWTALEERVQDVPGFQLRPGQKPATAPTTTLPTEPESLRSSSKPVTLVRDTNAWCPFCERVWLALEEKGLDFDSVLVNLQDKPEWYKNVVPTTKVPAVAFADGQIVYESKDILLALEERFPDQGPLLPSDAAERQEAMAILAEMEDGHDVGGKGFAFMAGGSLFNRSEPRDPAKLPQFRAEFEEQLAWLEGLLARHDSPYFLRSGFSILDIMMISSLERLAAALPHFRGFQLVGNAAYPALGRWLSAMDSRPAYQRVKTDSHTYKLLFSRMGSIQPAAATQAVDEATMEARRGVVGRIVKNKAEIVADIKKNSGLAQEASSETIEMHLRRMCAQLLDGAPGPKASEPADRAIGAAALAFFRQRVTSPRDMPAREADEFRAAADAVLLDTY